MFKKLPHPNRVRKVSEAPESVSPTTTCPECGAQIAASLRSCPACRRLIHGERLKELARLAEAATAEGELTEAISAWREALQLLPPESRQADVIAAKVVELSGQIEKSGVRPPPRKTEPTADAASDKSRWGAKAAGLGAIGLLLWKFKFVLVFIATKGKLLLLGLTKSGTLLTMVASLGVYWAAWGWKFAAGLVASIYVHEMGHVAALRRYGIKASAPMFIPGLGAMVRLKEMPATAREDSRVGLAGPVWGFGAALATYGVYLVTGWPSWAAIARVAAWINLFNLMPVWQLDGARGFRSLGRADRWLVVLAMGMMWLWVKDGLLLLIFILAVVRTVGSKPSESSDRYVLGLFLVLLVGLSAMCHIRVPIPA